jgi:hypothetical protein
MTAVLTITDGTDSVTFGDTGVSAYLDQFQQATPAESAEWVTETQQVKFYGGNSTVDANIQKLTRLFETARRYQENKSGTRVFVNLLIDSTTWRSEIADGRIVMTASMVKHERALGERQASVIWKRRAYWEGSETPVPLSNHNGNDITNGLRVYNCVDTVLNIDGYRQVNFAQINAGSIGGDLPAPIKLTWSGPGTSGNNTTDLWVGLNAFADQNLSFSTEGEATMLNSTSSSTCSGGAYGYVTMGSGYDQIEIDLNNVHQYNGRYFRVMARLMYSAEEPLRIQAVLTDRRVHSTPGTEVVIDYDLDYNFRFYDLGAFRIPLYDVPGKSINGQLQLMVRGSGGQTISLDNVQLLPLDGYRYLQVPDIQNVVVDDQIDGISYGYQDFAPPLTPQKWGPVIGSGELLLFPGRWQRLVFAWNSGVWSNGTYSALVQVSYRPRRRMV